MIPEIADAMQDEAFLVDELKIIAGEAMGLTSKDRESLRQSAALLGETVTLYGRVYFRLKEVEGQLIAAQERLREANAALAKSNVFPATSASMKGVWVAYNG